MPGHDRRSCCWPRPLGEHTDSDKAAARNVPRRHFRSLPGRRLAVK